MSKAILGIHHVTAIASDPQTNLDFYAGVLGLRLATVFSCYDVATIILLTTTLIVLIDTLTPENLRRRKL